MKNKAIKDAIERIETTIRRKLNEDERRMIELSMSILWLDARADCLTEVRADI